MIKGKFKRIWAKDEDNNSRSEFGEFAGSGLEVFDPDRNIIRKQTTNFLNKSLKP